MNLFRRRLAADRKSAESLQRFVAGLAARVLCILDPAERRSRLEIEIRDAFGFRRVELLMRPGGPERFSAESTRIRDLFSRVAGILEGTHVPYLNERSARSVGASTLLRSIHATYVMPVYRQEQTLALLIVDSGPEGQLEPAKEDLLQQAAGQTALVLENSMLLQGKLDLERALSSQAQLAQLGEMTARIAHEIKNPLSAIKTIVQVLQENHALASQHGHDLRLIEGEVNRLSSTVNQLLDFARPARDPAQDIRLHEVVQATLAFLARDIERMRITVQDEVPDDLPCVKGSQIAFREIMLNLLLNAIQAGGEGSRIRLQAWQGILEDGSEKFVVLIIEDDGPGVPAAIQRRVFEPFFTTKQRGTGLGLPIILRHIEQMGGRIALESPARDGRGTRFLMHLPL